MSNQAHEREPIPQENPLADLIERVKADKDSGKYSVTIDPQKYGFDSEEEYWRRLRELAAGFASLPSNGNRRPESETVAVVQEPDWKTASDEAFLTAAKSVFVKNAALLKRLA